MKGYNLDLHVGVRDAQYILERLGHSLDVWSISDHHHLMGWERKKVEICNQYTWHSLDDKMCQDFYLRYKDELSKYDFFYVFYAPAFAKLYEKFNKPIIMHVPLRYEIDFCNDTNKWHSFNDFLRRGIDNEQIIPIVNNLYDKRYLEMFTDREWTLIPSICDYTNTQYSGKKNKSLYCSKLDGFENFVNVPSLVNKKSFHNLSWKEICDFKCIVYIPYSNTLMSVFEQYTSNIPLLFPSKKFLRQLKRLYPGHVMSEISWNQLYNLPSRSIIKASRYCDPNDYLSLESFDYWSSLSDFYDEERMPYIEYFDSIGELEYKLVSLDFFAISDKMKEHNIVRKEKIFKQWQEVFKKL